MKNALIALLLIASLALGGLYFSQNRRTKEAQTGADNLQQNLADLQSTLAAKDKGAEKMRSEVDDQVSIAAAKIKEAERLKALYETKLTNQTAAAIAPAATNAKPVNALAEMFKNPEMKELIKSQQKIALGTMIDKNYGKFFAGMHLAPEQSAALKELILNKQLGAAELGMSMFSESSDSTKRGDMIAQVKAGSDAADAKIKEFLGDDNYNQFQNYEKSIPDRMVVGGFKDQLAIANPLNDDQEQQLVAAMSQERQAFKFTNDFSDKDKLAGDLTSMFTEDRINTYFQEMGQLNQQYLSKAQTILKPDQVAAFGKYLENQQSVAKTGMQMAAKMFAPTK